MRARDHLLSLQHPDGWWKGELETNVTMDAEDLLLREFLGIRDAERDRALRRAGSAPSSATTARGRNFYGGPGDLSTTIEAYVALRLAGDEPDAAHMRTAAAFVRAPAAGSSRRACSPTSGWRCSARGRGSRCRRCPPELMLLPSWVPLNVYDFACWARQTVVALTVVLSLPAASGRCRSRSTSCTAPEPWSPPARQLDRPAGRCVALDRVLHALPAPARRRRLRELALARAERWIVDRQEADGSWGGIQPPWVYSLIALHLRGYPLDHPVIARGLDGLERSRSRTTGRPAARGLPVAGLGHRAGGRRARRRRRPRRRPGARARGATGCSTSRSSRAATGRSGGRGSQPGGWAFEFANANYPDIDDTAEVVLALLASRAPATPSGPTRAIERGARWARGDAELRRRLGRVRRRQLPRDRPRPAVLRLRRGDRPAERRRHRPRDRDAGRARARRRPARRAGVEWLLADQEADGSWFGRWGVNHVYGTGRRRAGAGRRRRRRRRRAAIRRAVQLARGITRTPTAGGARTAAPTTTRPGSGAGESTASQTAWALLALDAAGERSRRGRARRRLAGRDAAAGRHLGRAAVHRHRLPV